MKTNQLLINAIAKGDISHIKRVTTNNRLANTVADTFKAFYYLCEHGRPESWKQSDFKHVPPIELNTTDITILESAINTLAATEDYDALNDRELDLILECSALCSILEDTKQLHLIYAYNGKINIS